MGMVWEAYLLMLIAAHLISFPSTLSVARSCRQTHTLPQKPFFGGQCNIFIYVVKVF